MTAIPTLSTMEFASTVLHAPGPVVLDFYQASCPPCRALEPRLARVAQRYTARAPLYRVDIDRDLSIAEHFEVTSIPTVLFLRAGGIVERLDGLITEADIQAAFDRILRD